MLYIYMYGQFNFYGLTASTMPMLIKLNIHENFEFLSFYYQYTLQNCYFSGFHCFEQNK